MHTLWTVLIAIGALVLAAGAGAPLTAGILRWADRRRERGEPARDGTAAEDDSAGADGDSAGTTTGTESGAQPPAERPAPTGSHPEEILRGGLWIGILERLAVAGCILLDYPAGIAVVVAIKGLGRFSTLRDEPASGVSERFLVGTLTSYLWAAAVAVAAVGALGAIP